jgi:hypothetical protein
MEEGLLQLHGILPNSKQEGIFRILCKNPNRLNSQITGNLKLGKAIDIKDKLDAEGLLFCKHSLDLHHRDNKNNFKQMFQCKVACRAIAANNVHQILGGFKKVGQGWYPLAIQRDLLRKQEKIHMVCDDGAGCYMEEAKGITPGWW